MTEKDIHRRRAIMAAALAEEVNIRGEAWLFEEMSPADLERATQGLLFDEVHFRDEDDEFWNWYFDKLDEHERRIEKIWRSLPLDHLRFVSKKEITKWSRDQIDVALQLIDVGKTEDLCIEPFYLFSLAQRRGFTGTLEEIEGMTLVERMNVLKAFDQIDKSQGREYRQFIRADTLLGYLLISYPLVIGALVWMFLGLPIFPESEQELQLIPNWALPFISWAAENDVLFLAYHLVSFGPAILAAICSLLLVMYANVAREIRPKGF
ncbi:hypothetical protein HKCCSP123_06170 [Rhodobacterales bacterium HKCCSP123]|nr:hypothetical protein [Rhodobacterales bacterium HKCCSP123]